MRLLTPNRRFLPQPPYEGTPELRLPPMCPPTPGAAFQPRAVARETCRAGLCVAHPRNDRPDLRGRTAPHPNQPPRDRSTPRLVPPTSSQNPWPTPGQLPFANPTPAPAHPLCRFAARAPRILNIRAAQAPRSTRHGILSRYGSRNQRSIRQAQTVERGFAAVAEDIADIRARMATKDDLAAVKAELKGEISDLREEMREGFASIREELRDIRQRLEALEEAARNSAGLTKEIDHLMARVRTIERHLGIETKIAA